MIQAPNQFRQRLGETIPGAAKQARTLAELVNNWLSDDIFLGLVAFRKAMVFECHMQTKNLFGHLALKLHRERLKVGKFKNLPAKSERVVVGLRHRSYPWNIETSIVHLAARQAKNYRQIQIPQHRPAAEVHVQTLLAVQLQRSFR
jgi:hypothetical protein